MGADIGFVRCRLHGHDHRNKFNFFEDFLDYSAQILFSISRHLIFHCQSAENVTVPGRDVPLPLWGSL